MTRRVETWDVRLSDAAQADFYEIIDWTKSHFGNVQADAYAETLSDAIDSLTDGATVSSARSRDDLLPGLFTLHVARRGHKGRHVVLFRIENAKNNVIEVLRILHDSMDFARHLPEEK